MWPSSLLVLLAAAAPWASAAPTPDALAGPGWKVLASAEGDLDGDGKPDAAVALGRADEQEARQELPRWLLVARRGADGKLRPWAWSSGPVLCRQCGGVFGDPLEGLAINKGVLAVNHYGGSNWRWGITDKFLYQDGRFRHIGKTNEGFFTLDQDYLHERDHNLLTGYVIVTRRGMGLVGRQAYHELWAPVLGAVPAVFPGRPTRLVTADDVVEGRAGWNGAADLSARLTAAVVGDKLWVNAEVTDDRVTRGDALRLVDARGKLVAPLELKEFSRPGGWDARAAFPLAKLEGTDVWQASIEVLDDDGAGRPKKVISTSQGGRSYPGAIRRAKTLMPPDLGGAEPGAEAFEDDPRLDRLDN